MTVPEPFSLVICRPDIRLLLLKQSIFAGVTRDSPERSALLQAPHSIRFTVVKFNLMNFMRMNNMQTTMHITLKPTDLLDRDREWTRLLEAATSDRPELCIVLGRRRTGKSYLLTRYAAAFQGIYYQATRKTEREQLTMLSRIIGEHFDDPAFKRVAFESWEHLFGYLAEKAAGAPLVVVLDEFTYLADAAPALPSIIQHEWDHHLPGTKVKLVLSGSHISAMRKLTGADQPLFGRRTAQLEFFPFHYADAARFAPDYSAHDKLRLYGVFGGLPGQLALVDPQLSFSDNASRLILDPTARLHDEAVHMFDAFLGEAEVHYSIIEAIANGETRWSKISNRVGRTSSSLLNPLNWLMEMGIVQQEAPITEYPNPARNKLRYMLTDTYLIFWHRFISGLRARGLATLIPSQDLWEAYVAPRLDQYMGRVFEEACRTFVVRSQHPILPFRPVQVGSWWTDDGQEEVDVVALGLEGEVLFGEAKWGKVSRSDFTILKRRSELILPQIKGVRSVHYALFSAGGIQDEATRALIETEAILYFPIEVLYEFRGM
jgi:AAA+ ATPase superfamily predicted ATPase